MAGVVAAGPKPQPLASRSHHVPSDLDWRRSSASADLTIRDAIALVDSCDIAIVVDADDRLLGTLTDAEIRRALLRGAGLDDAARPFMTKSSACRGVNGGLPDARVAPSASHAPAVVVDADLRVVGVDTHAPIDLSDRRVVVMAGGLGTRLRPLTARRPKPLVHVAGRPLLERTIERLREQGLRRFTLCVGYRSRMIERHFGSGDRFGVEIDYVDDGGTLGTAGPLRLIEPRPSSAIVVINGDVLTSVRFDRILALHAQSAADATMCVCTMNMQLPYGIVQLEGDRIDSVLEKPARRCWINAGIYVLEPSILDEIPYGVCCDMPTIFNNLVTERRRIAAFPLHEDWIHVATRLDVEDATARLTKSPQAESADGDL